jgi:hypothetical protein
MNLAEAIAERRNQIAAIQLELEQLEAAANILGGHPATVKPPPVARKEKPVRAEKPTRLPRSRPGDATFARCGHLRSGENLIEYVYKNETKQLCRTCKNEKQRARRDGAAASKVAPVVEAPITVTLPAPAHAAAAAKWAGSCPMLDSDSGRRCSLPGGHPLPHNASGRPFSAAAAVNIAAMGGTVRRAGGDA